ncbi:putative F-box domain, leucine-rich repeat domain superfamily, F-box-like domain superfamily [Helianthus annuus]|nr:putative F-box domain, leucine-rich repeat domain superfamily, F-box-like domain superfamily [Helianthus annuus]KAJ0825922.1 putative F-box domain, leucine-rich repeat domain superfamily, F-box-like domain superfamily [Helianthus annuus]
MKPEYSHQDRISYLPSSLIQTILTLLPIRDAFRTTAVSRNWRHHCVNLPKLEFDDRLLQGSSNNKQSHIIKCKVLHAIYSVLLLLHRGPVLEFSLCVSQLPSCCEIILHLANNNTLEKFNLFMSYGNDYKLPKSFFGLHQELCF